MSKIYYYASKIEPSVQVYALAAKFRLKEQNDHIKCLLNQQTERSWPDSGAAQGPTISPKNQLPYSDHHQLPQLWRSTTLVFKPLQCNAVKNCFRKW